jgi:glycerate 2-kinase
LTNVSNLTQLRLAAREIFDEALRASDAGAAVRRAIHCEEARLRICDTIIKLYSQQGIYAIAIGKAALAMASGLDEILGERLTAGIVTGNAARYGRDAGEPQARPPQRGCRAGDPGWMPALQYGTARGSERVNAGRDAGVPQAGMPALQWAHGRVTVSSRWRVFPGGHPEPNEQSLAAAQASFDLLERADKERAPVIFLISGGGSAMLEWPISEDITLPDLRVANKALVNSGASISEINAVRRAFSAVKGGRLAARAPNCDQVTLIVSDVPPGEERSVASGPTLMPPGNAPNAPEVVELYGLHAQLPESVVRAIDRGPASLRLSDEADTPLRQHFALLDNNSALRAAAEAARRRSFVTEIARDISDQPIEAGCAQLLTRLEELRQKARSEESTQDETRSVCLISGGEFACPVKGDGTGGRNLETGLRLAIESHKRSEQAASQHSDLDAFLLTALFAGTDGLDGNSPAAGAIVDSTTIERAHAIGLEPEDSLDRSDAYAFFVALGDTITTGPTGTNVRDVRVLLASRSP